MITHIVCKQKERSKFKAEETSRETVLNLGGIRNCLMTKDNFSASSKFMLMKMLSIILSTNLTEIIQYIRKKNLHALKLKT